MTLIVDGTIVFLWPHSLISGNRSLPSSSSSSHHQQPSSSGDKLTLKRVLDFVSDKPDAADMREMNRKLQTMLEETLTKNMHLQQVSDAPRTCTYSSSAVSAYQPEQPSRPPA